jgi:hypothetical protein
MPRTTYDVRVRKASVRKTDIFRDKRVTTHRVRRQVAGPPRKEPFRTAALANRLPFRTVGRGTEGEAFDIESSRPVSMSRTDRSMSWYEFACEYLDLKWLRIAATHAGRPLRR